MTSEWARPLVHWSIDAVDPEGQRAFYSQLFNWTIRDGPIMLIGPGLGGPEPGPAGQIQSGSTARITLFVQVSDVRATLDRAIELGAKERFAPFDLPGGQTLAGIEDPEGNHLTLVQQ